MLRDVIWREPKTDGEALALLRLVGALECRGFAHPTMMLWLASQDVHTVLGWFTAYGAARIRGDLAGNHELAHAFSFLSGTHPQLRPLVRLMFP